MRDEVELLLADELLFELPVEPAELSAELVLELEELCNTVPLLVLDDVFEALDSWLEAEVVESNELPVEVELTPLVELAVSRDEPDEELPLLEELPDEDELDAWR